MRNSILQRRGIGASVASLVFYEIYVHLLPKSSRVLIACGLASQQWLQFYRNGKLIRQMDRSAAKSDNVGCIWRHDETVGRYEAIACSAASVHRAAFSILVLTATARALGKNMSTRRPHTTCGSQQCNSFCDGAFSLNCM